MMKYRAVVVGIERDGHPVQGFAQHESQILKWAEEESKANGGAKVKVFINEERLLGIVQVVVEAKFGA